MAKLVHNVQKKQHRERSQVSERARFGFLEKHKDYTKRAQNFHKKQATLKVLRSKAKERNPDEYYHAMHSRKVDSNGVLVKSRHANGEDPSLTMDQVKLLKTQDSNYVRTMRQSELNKASRLSQQLMFKASGQHTVFVEDEDSMRHFTPEQYFDTTSEMLQRRENRLTKDQLARTPLEPSSSIMPSESLQKKKVKKIKMVAQHLDREKKLQQVYQRMDLQRELMKKGSKKKVADSSGAVSFKWKKQRKR
ncbi:ABL032Cp [Eremothecium gossypii ATCC 10895]|uniref:U3 small nucleolar RNA-associated protein 11 n=1 Tax=Eremothecium gossypii (strain ATCC 10895 / CBS 109.51 / FGSC 9923 / NRRL Y-1056) TaxID=284811 RepID=Q75DP9_EREGS|nr:ABL032Cp [Eremothecium gossypii ATCC 10895]AAS50739.1 ABL032Cp [Eremothecium gossypii ATCC 10895]AEY95028.1 FABL032Cp [Eremothecium gossypii FDAG1]